MEFIQSLLITLGIFVLGLVSPGPNLIVLLKQTLNYGFKAGVMTGLGIALGDFIYAFIGLYGLTILMSYAGWVFGMIKVFGGIYIIFIGFKTLKRNNKSFCFSEPKKIITLSVCFRKGILTDLSNPKTIIFFTSIFATLINEQTPPRFLMTLLILIFVTSILFRIGLAYMFSRRFVQKTYFQFRNTIEEIFGILLVLFGVNLLVNLICKPSA